MKLHTQIKKHLEDTGLKAYQLADLANIPRSSLYRYLNKEQDLVFRNAEKVKKAIELTQAKSK